MTGSVKTQNQSQPNPGARPDETPCTCDHQRSLSKRGSQISHIVPYFQFVPILLVISTSSMLIMDQRTMQVKYRIPATDIYRISLSPYFDDIAVFHVRSVSLCLSVLPYPCEEASSNLHFSRVRIATFPSSITNISQIQRRITLTSSPDACRLRTRDGV